MSRRQFSPELKQEAAESAFDELEQIGGDKYPIVIQSWRNNL